MLSQKRETLMSQQMSGIQPPSKRTKMSISVSFLH